MALGSVAARPRGYPTAPSVVFLLCLRKSVMGANIFCSEQKRPFLGPLALPVFYWGVMKKCAKIYRQLQIHKFHL